MVKYLFSVLFFTALVLQASDVLLYDANSFGVSNRPYALLSSVNTTDYQNLTNALINPTLPGSGTLSDWKVVNTAVLLLDATDLNAISNATVIAQTNKLNAIEAANRTNAFQWFFQQQEANQIALRSAVEALQETILPQINILRNSNGLPSIADSIAKSNVYRLYTNKVNALLP